MKRFLTSLAILLALFVLASNLCAFDHVLIFSDDFSGGSVENWVQELGEWTAENYEFCQLECGT